MLDVQPVAELIVLLLGAYFAVGALVAILFLAFGIKRIDASARGASLFFRPMIFLGCAVLWPFVILRFLSGKLINESTETDE